MVDGDDLTWLSKCIIFDWQMIKDLRKQSLPISEQTTDSEVEEVIRLCSTERDAILQGPRRQCTLQEYPDSSKDVLGKVWTSTRISELLK